MSPTLIKNDEDAKRNKSEIQKERVIKNWWPKIYINDLTFQAILNKSGQRKIKENVLEQITFEVQLENMVDKRKYCNKGAKHTSMSPYKTICSEKHCLPFLPWR